VTADGLTVEGASAGTVTAATFTNTTSADGTRVQAVLQNVSGACNVNLVSERVGANFGADFIVETSDTVDGTDRQRLRVAETGDISFYEDTGTTAKLFWDASTERLAIGTSSPSHTLQAVDTSAGATTYAVVTDNSGASGTTVAGFGFANGGALKSSITAAVFGNDFMTFNVGGSGTTERLRIDASGNVGIGTNSPNSTSGFTTLTLNNATTGGIIDFENNTSLVGRIYNTSTNFHVYNQTANSLLFGTGGTERARIDSSGNVGIGTSSPSQALVVSRSSGNTYLDISRATQSQGQVALQLTGGTGGTNWIMYQDTSSDDLRFFGNSSNRMTITSGGNVGIGVSSPSALLHVSANNPTFKITDTSTTGSILLQPDLSSGGADRITSDVNNLGIFTSAAGKYILFGTAGTERMRIDSSGNVLVGKTSTGFVNSNNWAVEGASVVQGHVSSLGSGSVYTYFIHGTSSIGSISQNGTTAVLYNTSSDERLKDNIVDAPSASDDIDAIQVRSFDWKADGSHQKYGMVAQELVTVAPEAVSAPEDPDEMMGVDYSKLVPMLIKEIQSLRARVQQLENN
jgi:hypothetical protein